MRGKYIIAIVAIAAVADVASLVYANGSNRAPDPSVKVESQAEDTHSPTISPIVVEPKQTVTLTPESTIADAILPAPTTTPTPTSEPEFSANCDFELHETYTDGEEVNINHKCQTTNENGAEITNEISVKTTSSGASTVDISVTNE